MKTSPGLPTGTLTFLFTDIESSTSLWEQNPERMRATMLRHDELIEAEVSENDGILVRPRGEGDSRFAVFPLASDGVAAAVSIQRAFFKEDWPIESPLRVRMALHTGEADLHDGDYYGPAVNRCARIRGAAHGGQILLSLTTGSLVQDSLPDGVSLRDLGEYNLRDIQRPERIFQLVIEGLPAEFPSLRADEGLHTNLPSVLSSFIGRGDEITQVKQLLQETRLLTISGAGGSGKTRLALQVGTQLVDRYAGGVWLVDLAPLTNPDLILKAIAGVFDIREEEGHSLLLTLTDALRTKSLLLILDNCEHLLEAVASLTQELIEAAPRLFILATSREPLGIVGERVWYIPPLSFPEALKSGEIKNIQDFDAIQLFINRAAIAKPTFKLHERNALPVANIVKKLEGNPLAIELAAARVKVLPVKEIDERLDVCFRLLTSSSRTVHPRQQTLRALIDWSYNLLSEKERILLRRLGIFKGGWTLAAAEAVCSSDEIDTWEVLDLLTSLVDKSLAVPELIEDRQRYRYLEMIRQYAVEHLEESGEKEEIARKHANYYLSLAEESYQELWGPRQAYWLALLRSEHDNLRSALEWMRLDPNQAEMMLRMTGALWRFWDIHGHISEGLSWMEHSLEANPNAPPGMRAHAMRGAGYLARQQGDYARAKSLHEKSLALYKEIQDKRGIARALAALGEILWLAGDPKGALELNNESLALHYELGDKAGVAASLEHLGVVARDHGNYSHARELLEESLKIQRQLGNRLNTASCLNNLALVAYLLCEYKQAVPLFDEALEIYRELNDRWGISETMISLGNVAKDRGDFKQAMALYNQSLELKQELGDKHGVARGITGLAEVAFYQGNYPLAKQLGEQSLGMYKERGAKRGMFVSIMVLAVAETYQGNIEQAESLVKEGLALSTEIDTPRSQAYAKVIYGLGEYARGDLQAAVRHLEDALAVFRKVDDGRSIAQALVNLARTVYRQGDLDTALKYLEESISLSRELDVRWSLAFSLEILGLVKRSSGDLPEALALLRESLQLSAEQENQQGIANSLGAMAGLAALNHQAANSARLFSAAANVRESMGVVMGVDDQREYERYLAVLRQELDEEQFNQLMLEGCSLNTQQAVDLACQLEYFSPEQQN
jgi:predicted ATPase/class 3 adenylate cyclase